MVSQPSALSAVTGALDLFRRGYPLYPFMRTTAACKDEVSVITDGLATSHVIDEVRNLVEDFVNTSAMRKKMNGTRIIDSHIHCGIQHVDLPYESIEPLLRQAEITDACLFAPVEDIYDRNNYYFEDNNEWRRIRRSANHYLLKLAANGEPVFPYLFVWNDFAIDELVHPYCGIKWHRHSYEPEYNYEDPRCIRMIKEITRRRLPIVFEESFDNTLRFVERLASEAVIIIPHLGGLNGSYQSLDRAGIWRKENVYADSALASSTEIRHFLEHYGPEKLLFGSDFPFGTPSYELGKIEGMRLANESFEKVVSGNILSLIEAIEPPG